MQAVLFDFDGVIARSMEDHYEGWRKALEEYGIDMIPEELYILEGAGVEELASQFTRKFNLPVEETPKIIQKKQLYYDQIKKIEFYPYLIDVFEWIKEKNLKTGLVTGGENNRVFDALENFGLSDRFEVIVTGNDVQHTKPSPEPYLMAAHELDVEPAECIAIENAPLGIQSAKNAGMRCIAVATTLSPMYLKMADVIADDLEKVLEILKKMY
jgi:beta-phosphoglucomutase